MARVRCRSTFLPGLLMLATLLFPGPVAAYLDLAAASIEKLDNGLTVIVLEDPSFPVVSVQMLYRSGAIDEVSGKTGLAHFLEHMAFRSSKNFPDGGLVSSIYAVGGEWHGYTWLDQTTYFATVPAAELGLLLRIEADRMARLELPGAALNAEAGAILSEMHGYENDPATVLQDHVLYLAFLAHPYRNNSIGWESDVLGITRQDLVEFYETHYQPANAVLAIAGDVKKDDVLQQVRDLFGRLEGRPAPVARYTPEPPQTGQRRVILHGGLDRKYFSIVHRAPPVSSPDFAAFLLTQELLSAGSGISFLQNDWGTPARPASALGGITADLATWFPPSEQDYVFIISGSLPADGDEEQLEASVEAGIEALRERFRQDASDAGEALEQARARVLRELVFDVQTTEDAAHQLAFFAGLDALEVLTGLPNALGAVSIADISTVLDRYLVKDRSVVGWYLPARRQIPGSIPAESKAGPARQQPDRAPVPAQKERAGPAVHANLANGTPVIIKRSTASRTAAFAVVVPRSGYSLPPGVTVSEPARGLISLNFELLSAEVGPAIARAREILDSAVPLPATSEPDAADPASLFEFYLEGLLGDPQTGGAEPGGSPLLLVVSGDVEPESVLRRLQAAFGDLPARSWEVPAGVGPALPVEVEARVLYPVAQERLGYVARVPGPSQRTAAACQVALYILSHGDEGRFGKEAISRQGLVYSIDSAYRTDGGNDWMTLSMGVDPAKLPAAERLLKDELARLRKEPPSAAEVDEAKTHLLGRLVSASQSNAELADSLIRQWIRNRDAADLGEWARQIDGVQREDVLELLPEITRGSIIKIRNPDR